MSRSVELAYIGQDPQGSIKGVDVKRISHIDELSKDFLGCCIIDMDQVEQNALLISIHSNPNYWGWLLFVTQSSSLSGVLSDGIWESSKWQSMQEILLKRKSGIRLAGKNRFIEWLWLGPHRRVIPIKSPDTQSIYSYPIVDCYHQQIERSGQFFIELDKKDLLDKDTLVDKIRLCSTCKSSLLNYIETCPNCQSIDVIERVLLHCFTCGYVGDETQFTRKGKLECPKCLTQIRHIGVDYDRPLETFLCNTCDSTFIESDTMVRCFNCDNLSSISSLIAKKIFTYKLGGFSEYYLRNDDLILSSTLDFEDVIEPYYFSSLLPWLNKTAFRYGQKHCLMALHFNSVEKELECKYKDSLRELVEQLSKKIFRIVRDTDICCNYRDNLMLVFMYMPTQEDIDLMQDKVVELAGNINEDGFYIDVCYHEIPDADLINSQHWLDNKLLRKTYG